MSPQSCCCSMGTIENDLLVFQTSKAQVNGGLFRANIYICMTMTNMQMSNAAGSHRRGLDMPN